MLRLGKKGNGNVAVNFAMSKLTELFKIEESLVKEIFPSLLCHLLEGFVIPNVLSFCLLVSSFHSESNCDGTMFFPCHNLLQH